MALEQFKEALLKKGYKVTSENYLGAFYTTLRKRNKSITIQEFDEHTNVFYEKQIKGGSIELNQHRRCRHSDCQGVHRTEGE